MKIEYLEECVDLAETLSFTETARRLFMSQSVLSKHIASLEREVGFAIFERGHQGVRLAKGADVFIDDARRVVASYRALKANLASRRERVETLSIGYLVGAVGDSIPQAHIAYSEKDYSVNLRYYTYEFVDVMPALERGDIDVAVTTVPPSVLADPRYGSLVLFEDECVAAVSSDHPLAAKAAVRPRDLGGETVLFSSTPEWTVGLLDYLKPEENGIMIEREIRDMHALPLLLTVENCVGLMPGHLMGYYAATYGERYAFPKLEGFTSHIAVAAIWRRDAEIPSVSAYAETLRDVVRLRVRNRAESSCSAITRAL